PTFFRQVVFELAPDSPSFDYRPGQYIQMNIPDYSKIPFSRFELQEPYSTVWRAQHVYENQSENHTEVRRNYSLASNPERDTHLRFNTRIATPPRGQDCNAGVGS